MSPRDTPDDRDKERAKGVPGRGEEDNVTYVNFGKRRKVSSAEETLPGNEHPSRQKSLSPRENESPTQHSDERSSEGSQDENSELDISQQLTREYRGQGSRARQSPVWSERVKSDTPRDSIFNPAAERVMKLVTNMTDSGRLARGRQYARSGHVVDLDIRDGAVHGQVAGSQNQPFAVLMQLPYRDKEDIEKLTGLLARSAGSISSAIRGELTGEALDLLLAPTGEDIRFDCTCPDHGHVCKHIVAVADRLSMRIDADPLQLFALRGINILSLQTMVMEAADKVAQESAGESPDDKAGAPSATMPEGSDSLVSDSADAVAKAQSNELYWNGRALPDMPRPKVAPALDDSDPDLLRKAMRAVSHTNVDLLRAVSDVEDLYHFMTSKN